MQPAHRAARVLSAAGEHSAVWLAMCATGAVLDRRRRPQWLGAGRSIVQAHAASVVLKRAFRQRRPDAALRQVAVASEWTFPSSHATGSAAAVVALSRLVPVRLTAPLAVGIAGSRVVLRVHRRRDLAGGALLGAGWAALRARRAAPVPRLYVAPSRRA